MMTRIAISKVLRRFILLYATMISPVMAGPNYLFQVTNSGLISTLDVTQVANPVSTYQITGLGSSDVVNAASFDPITNRFYYVDNLPTNQAQLDYVQLNAQGVVVGQTTLGILSSQVTSSFGADFFAGRDYINQNGTNLVYAYDPNNLNAAPISLALPTPSANPSTQFFLGDLTFNASKNLMFIAGSLGEGTNRTFIYEYLLNGTSAPTLVASRNYTGTASDPRLNGIIFNQDSGLLYGYSQTGELYTVNTTTLTIASDVGFNPVFFQGGDLAGFTSSPISAVPEPSGMVSLSIGMLSVLICKLTWKRIASSDRLIGMACDS